MRQTTTAEVRPDEGTIVPSHRQAIDRVWGLMAALAICGVLGGISLLVPPFIEDDSATGFQAWRGTLLGAANSVIGVTGRFVQNCTLSGSVYCCADPRFQQ